MISTDKVSEHFRAQEFACRCGGKRCPVNGPYKGTSVSPDLLKALEKIRATAGGRPITITSGFRCANHPVEAAKHSPGFHTKGLAADIKVKGLSPEAMYAIAEKIPEIKGIGVDDRAFGYIHVDVRNWKNRAVWAYDKGGRIIPYVRKKDAA